MRIVGQSTTRPGFEERRSYLVAEDDFDADSRDWRQRSVRVLNPQRGILGAQGPFHSLIANGGWEPYVGEQALLEQLLLSVQDVRDFEQLYREHSAGPGPNDG